MNKRQPLATAILIAHENRQELQHSLNSVRRAAAATPELNLDIVILDEQSIHGKIAGATIISDPNALKKLSADYIFVIPRQSLVTSNWFSASLSHFGSNTQASLLRPELSVEWGGGLDIRIFRQTESLDPLFSLYRPLYGGVVALTHKAFVDAVGGQPADATVSSLLSAGAYWLGRSAAVIPQTAVFTQRDISADSPPSAPLEVFDFSAAKHSKIQLPDSPPAIGPSQPDKRSIVQTTTSASKRYAKAAIRRTPLLPLAKRLHSRYTQSHGATPAANRPATLLPNWLVEEWRQLHRLDNRLFPGGHVLHHGVIEVGPTSHARMLAHCYMQLASKLRNNHYDYILFAPWLIRGGADKYTIYYANTINSLYADYNVLVVTTLDKHSEWANQLDADIDYCGFGTLTARLSDTDKLFLLERLVAQSTARFLHVINSELAYDFIASRRDFLRQQGIRIIATSFSQEIDKQGKLLGYSHSHMPEIYEQATAITSDNDTLLDMWHNDYGFDRRRTVKHRLPYSVPELPEARDTPADTLKVLWASRLSGEKLPQLAIEIGRLAGPMGISIDMYGTPAGNFDTAFLDTLPDNVTYRGPFDGLSTLPISEYDAFLYTSSFDGMPNTLLEVGSLGLPIVSSAVGGIPEIIRDGQTGILIKEVHDPGAYTAALQRLKDNPALRRELAGNLHAMIAKDYSEEQFRDAVTAMLTQLNR